MPAVSATTEARKSHAKSRISNGRDVLPNVDGRSLIARRYRDICAALIADSAGIERCSEARLQLIRRFAASSVLAEQLEAELANGEEIDIPQHALLCSSLVRLSTRIGINRVAKNIVPTLEQYLAATDSAAREREAKHIATIEDEDNE